MSQPKNLFSPAAGLSLLLAAAAAGAAPASANSALNDSAQSRYRAERAICLEGRSSQRRETCLKEAGAALAEARRARPGAQQALPDYLANALARCERVPAAERADCERLVRGEGSSSGSVAEGAIVRQIISKSVAPAASAASAP